MLEQVGGEVEDLEVEVLVVGVDLEVEDLAEEVPVDIGNTEILKVNTLPLEESALWFWIIGVNLVVCLQ